MADLPFHPVVSSWFAETLGTPTPAQDQGWAAIRDGRHTLIAAPTGSGKTLAAFLSAIDDLLRDGLQAPLEDQVSVVYVSPLKALSADIHKNLEEPLRAIRERAEAEGLSAPAIRSAVRTGDTPQSRRAAMLRTPPHILVTTPESLYLLLTAERSRHMLRAVRTVIVDEIHAVIGSRRGSHLALSLERLKHVVAAPLQRIGLSATQKPIEEVARFLLGSEGLSDVSACAIVDEGHQRAIDLAIEVPGSPLEAVMSHETWSEVYDRLAQLIEAHTTTLVFVNTRKMAERLAARLTDRLGEEAVTAHHGSLSKDKRLAAEDRLRAGSLKALVATASLELGIDIGHVDLVCQLGSPRWISTLIQRVGRSGHTVKGTPKGRLFPLSRDDLVECAALVWAVDQGELDRVITLPKPLDVLAQQTVAETACESWVEDDLFRLWQGAYPYRELERTEFDQVIRMLADGFVTRRGRRGALVHSDRVNGRVKGRRAARLTAITAGGAIPDNADYRVVLDPEETFVGTLNEDFAIESSAGDIFQLGNTSWRILAVNSGTVRVADAHGQPPTIPFWLGEAPGRSAELSSSVARLRHEVERRLGEQPEVERSEKSGRTATATEWLTEELGLPPSAAHQIEHYLGDAKRILGALPTQTTLVLERFFDESGGMQLILHAPFGSRVNRAWGLALRKKFCRQFNFELQAAATEEGLLLSLGPQHSFPLEDVFGYVHPNTLEETLVQALIDSPVFPTRWRWNATISLAVLRHRGGKRVPPPLQRMEADDLMAAAFPDAAACLENIGGDREIPDHPLVQQTLRDCLEEAMAMEELSGILTRVMSGEIRCVTRDTPEPSVLSHEILNSAPYSFLDDAPLEERRARAVQTRRAFEPSSAADLGALDPEAVQRVRDEVWPDPRDADELHDGLLTAGVLTEAEGERGREGSWTSLFDELREAGRAGRVGRNGARPAWWVSAERLPEVEAVLGPGVSVEPALTPPGELAQQTWTRPSALLELVRGRVQMSGPVTASGVARDLGLDRGDLDAAFIALEGQGVVLRGSFTGQSAEIEWCERRLLARIHRYTLNRLRAEIEPVSQADFMRFLFAWQKVAEGHRMSGLEGLAAVVSQLEGFETPAGAWETDVLGGRVSGYDPQLLDNLCLTGRVTWGRISPPHRNGNGRPGPGPIRSTPIALLNRDRLQMWLQRDRVQDPAALSTYASAVHAVLEDRGASFFSELVGRSGLLPTQVEDGLGELVANGLVTADSFTGLRALLVPSDRRRSLGGTKARSRRRQPPNFGVDSAGRWSLLAAPPPDDDAGTSSEEREEVVEAVALTLLRRYGVLFRRLLRNEARTPPWWELVRVLRRLEARGDVRGGRFVAGMSGEQFALPEAVGQLRRVRRNGPDGSLISLSAADPLNLTGVLTPGPRIATHRKTRIVYRDGVPIAVREGGALRALAEYDSAIAGAVERAATLRPVPPALRAYLGQKVRRPA